MSARLRYLDAVDVALPSLDDRAVLPFAGRADAAAFHSKFMEAVPAPKEDRYRDQGECRAFGGGAPGRHLEAEPERLLGDVQELTATRLIAVMRRPCASFVTISNTLCAMENSCMPF
jgi:hypothetical protein